MNGTVRLTQTLDAELVSRLQSVSFPTIGHFLEEGFLDPGIRSMLPNVHLVGRAVTVRIASADAFATNRALALLEPGDVLVIETGHDATHAPVGAVTACAAQCAGAAGIVVDGVVTDIVELRSAGLPVFARGTSVLTAKRKLDANSAVNVPVLCGGVMVNPGDVVMADDNGVLVLSPEEAAAIVDLGLSTDRAEPDILRRLRSGEAIGTVLPGGME
ncbi:RraA family protein [Pseudarthrobacter psychrotolerans]|uniref:Putative 4-hydroxy-4-methyl-2-oxoglutarate aldolase n=1 Tax=Pseudarthrobacter psychrotolerans TaxID=2697569 RepID=A0A6P1NIM2_9MICC|nr:RraA family protein [Pseudarthrobacter psychrotolerans]QHK20465.1 RraA family protein [Pseudarthrobacter psychrotolerans]